MRRLRSYTGSGVGAVMKRDLNVIEKTEIELLRSVKEFAVLCKTQYEEFRNQLKYILIKKFQINLRNGLSIWIVQDTRVPELVSQHKTRGN
jgi:hypothetical protein